MRKAWFIAPAAAFLAFAAIATPFVERKAPDGHPVAEWGVEKGKLPPFVFGGTDITSEGAEFFCQKNTGAVWARIGGLVYALNEPASDPAKRLGEDGVTFDTIPADDAANPVTSNADVATRIAAQAERLCNPAPIVVRERGAQTPFDFAMSLCAIIDKLDMATSPCSVSAGSRKIEASLDVTPSSGRAACSEISSFAKRRSWNLHGWELHILSPYSGDKSVAFCAL